MASRAPKAPREPRDRQCEREDRLAKRAARIERRQRLVNRTGEPLSPEELKALRAELKRDRVTLQRRKLPEDLQKGATVYLDAMPVGAVRIIGAMSVTVAFTETRDAPLTSAETARLTTETPKAIRSARAEVPPESDHGATGGHHERRRLAQIGNITATQG